MSRFTKLVPASTTRRRWLVSGLSGISLALLLAQAVGCSDAAGSSGGRRDCAGFGEGTEASCEELCATINVELCSDSMVACDNLNPSDVVEVCGVVLPAPPTAGDTVIELARSANVDEFAGSGPPQLGCFFDDGYPAKPGTSQTVALQGIAKVFSNGCQSNNVDIEVYTVKRGGADDGMPDQLVGTPISTAADCSVDGVGEEAEDCDPVRYECRYEYAGVPSETELLIVTSGMFWTPIYEYNVFVPNDEVVDGAYTKDIRALAQDDYSTIAQVAIGTGITAGNGAIAGEVHDCENVRLTNAIVDIDASKFITTYFTSDEDDPLPDTGAKATSSLSLYAALDIKPGPVTVAAAGVADGKLTTVGYTQARVFANAVTSVTFRGLMPYQVP